MENKLKPNIQYTIKILGKRNSLPRIIKVEANTKNTKKELNAIIKNIIKNNYKMHKLSGYEFLMPN